VQQQKQQQQQPITRQLSALGILIGVNSVAKQLEQHLSSFSQQQQQQGSNANNNNNNNTASCRLTLIIIADAKCRQAPPILTEHIKIMSCTAQIPCIALPCTEEQLGNALSPQLSSLCIAITVCSLYKIIISIVKTTQLKFLFVLECK